jgi:HK97 family phage portal protein
MMKPMLNKDRTQIIGWKQIDNMGNTISSWDQYQILHFRMPTPIDQIDGLPPSGTLSSNIAADIFARDYNGKFFQNNATPRLHIDLGNVSKEEMEVFIGKCEQKLKGQPHKNLVTRGGVKIEPIGIKNSDMEFTEYQKDLGRKTMAKYRVPPLILGFLESTSSMSAESQIAMFKFLAVSPVRKIIASRINKMIMRKLFPGIRAKFVWNPVDKMDLMQQSQIDERDVKSNIKTINEVRTDRGLGGVTYGDAPIPMPGQEVPNGPKTEPKKKPKGKNDGTAE